MYDDTTNGFSWGKFQFDCFTNTIGKSEIVGELRKRSFKPKYTGGKQKTMTLLSLKLGEKIMKFDITFHMRLSSPGVR